MDGGARWTREKAAASLNPSQVESTLLSLAANWPPDAPSLVDLIRDFPLGEKAILDLLAASSACATRFVRHPDILLWLQQPEICLSPRERAQMVGDLPPPEPLAADNFAALRLWKNREMTRIALRDVADVAPLEETTAELSHVAEICIRRVFDHWNAQLRQRYGSPNAEFAIVAMGKLGGRELNYSSDVDLIFLYSEEGQLTPHFSHHEFFNRLAEKILETFSTAHIEGALFRVDLRLRPEGSAGPLARSLDSTEYYYSGYGETWERLALIKARGISRSGEVAYDFLRRHQPFIYPKNPTPDLLEQIANVKRRIERDVVGEEELHRDVKLGRGGIREIEFVVQTLQFIHGAHHAFLQDTSTLKALQALSELELLPRNDIVDLDRAYRFLRRTEHRLQIEAEQQTHTVPTTPEHLRRLALSLGFSSGQEFSKALEREMSGVRVIFDRLIAKVPGAKAGEPVDLTIFADAAQAERALGDLAQGPPRAHVSPRTRQIFRKLRPLLLGSLSKTADPDATLNRFVRFVEAYGLRSLLFELLVANPRLLELVTRTFDASRFAADLLARHPQLLEEITRSHTLDRAMSTVRYLKELRTLGKKESALNDVRAYRQTQLLRILLRDVLDLADLATVCAEQSALAEACLLFANEILGGKELTIIALGKFGGEEITYGADLDVLFVGEESGSAERLLSAMAQPSAEGTLSRVDARLRPEGEKGPLVCSLERYAQYYGTRAQLWELQALTRARPIAGPLQDEFMVIAKSVWQRTGQHVNLTLEIDNMLERVRRERGTGNDFVDLKTGIGGIIEGEFLIQALQMRRNVWEPNWPRAVERLHASGRLTKAETESLKSSYEFLRRCESVLRRDENVSVSALPRDPTEQSKLARRLGFDKIDIFTEKYRGARSAIHEIYEQRMKRGPATGGSELSESVAEQKS
jgi:glutamate-ammonia-ligase adenylyltransferase